MSQGPLEIDGVKKTRYADHDSAKDSFVNHPATNASRWTRKAVPRLED